MERRTKDEADIPLAEVSEDALLEEIRRLGLGAARKLGLNDADAQDCAMELALRLFVRLAVLVVLLSSLAAPAQRAYLRKAASNHALNFQRGLRRRHHREGMGFCALDENRCALASPALPEDALLLKERQETVRQALAALEPAARELLCRHYIAGQPLAVIAADVSRTPSAVRQALYRARNQLRLSLASLGCEAVPQNSVRVHQIAAPPHITAKEQEIFQEGRYLACTAPLVRESGYVPFALTL